MARNLLYAQSGGVTAVINASAAGVIATAREAGGRIGRVLAARNGILGVLREALVDTAAISADDLARLRCTPGGAFGSCRFDLDPEERNPAQYDRLFAVLAAHDIGFFLYNGGNGSMETCRQIQAAARDRGYPLTVVGVPKTIDNDIVHTDCCPGFGSAAKYLATSVREVGLDLNAMTTTGGRAFVLEVMGRNAGWLAAACALGGRQPGLCPPHHPAARGSVRRGAVHDAGPRDGGAAGVMRDRRGGGAAGYRWADPVHAGAASQRLCPVGWRGGGHRRPDPLGAWLQGALCGGRLPSASGPPSGFEDRHQSSLCRRQGRGAECPRGQRDGVIGIKRLSGRPYRWRTIQVAFEKVANLERTLPPDFIAADGLGVTDDFRNWCRPLIAGEDLPPFVDGLPDYLHLQLPLLARLLPEYEP
jgi:hypothetical protein